MMKLLKSKAMLNLAKALCLTFTLIFGLMMFATTLADMNRPLVSNFFNQPMQTYEMADDFVMPVNPDTGEPYEPKDYPTLGVKDENYPWYYKHKFDSLRELKHGKTLDDGTVLRGTSAVAEQIEAEGAALLYNKENALPLAKNSKVSLFSIGSYRAFYGPQGAHGVGSYTNWFMNDDAYTKAGFQVNKYLWQEYARLHGNPGSTSGDTGTGATTPYRRNRSNTPVTQKFGDIAWSDHTGPEGKALSGIYTTRIQEVDGVTKTIQESVAEYGDAAIFNWTRQNGENADLMPGAFGTNEQTYLDGNSGYDACRLTDKERSTVAGIAGLRKANVIKKFIINVNSNNMLAMDFMKDSNIGPYIDAVIWTGGTGENGIYAVPKLLSGEYNFSGSLPVTAFYNNYDIPAVANLNSAPGTTSTGSSSELIAQQMYYKNAPSTTGVESQKRYAYVVYQEGVYVGYRYPETRYEDAVANRSKTGNFKYADTVFATFGKGLSYTKFDFSEFSVSRQAGTYGDQYTVSVRVTNSGSKPGKKAVQIYAQKPYTQYCIDNEIEVPAVEFVGFGKTKMLDPGESQTVTVHIDGKYLAAYDFMKAKTFVQNAGPHYFAVGNDAHDALNNILARKNFTTASGMDYAGNRNLSWSVELPFDAVKYSYSSNTGEKISNLFDDGNWNLYKNKGPETVEYVSRDDWEGTLNFFKFNPGGAEGTREYYSESYASGYEELTWSPKILEDEFENFDPEEGDDGVEYPTYDAKYSPDNPYILPNGERIEKQVSLIDLMYDDQGDWVAFDDPLWDALLDQMSWEESCRLVLTGFRHTEPITSINKPQSFEFNESNGLALSNWNSSTPDGQVENKALARAYNDPDKTQHGSPGDEDFCTGMAELWPNNPVMTGTMNVNLMYECGLLWGEEGMWAGFSGLYGVGANMLRTPYGSRHAEYFSEDPVAGGIICSYLVGGMQAMGMNNTIKHFFLNEADTHRVGTNIWGTEQAFREIYLRMFEIPIDIQKVTLAGYGEVTVGGAMNVMGSKGRMGPYMCVAYEPLQTGWLRNEAGLRGFSTTDTPESQIMSKAAQVKAGCTLSDSNDKDVSAFDPYKTGHGAFAHKLRLAAKHNMYHALHSNAMNGFAPGMKVIALTPAWIGIVAGIDIAAGVLFGLSLVFLAVVVTLRMVGGKKND